MQKRKNTKLIQIVDFMSEWDWHTEKQTSNESQNNTTINRLVHLMSKFWHWIFTVISSVWKVNRHETHTARSVFSLGFQFFFYHFISFSFSSFFCSLACANIVVVYVVVVVIDVVVDGVCWLCERVCTAFDSVPNKILVVCYCSECRFCVVCAYEYCDILDVYIIYLVFCCCCHHRRCRRFIFICDQFGSHMWCAAPIICNCSDAKFHPKWHTKNPKKKTE